MMSSSISTIAAAARRAVAALRRSTGAAARAVADKAIPLAAHAADVVATRIAPVAIHAARTVSRAAQVAAAAALRPVRSFFAVRTFSSTVRRAGAVATAAAAAVGLAYASSTNGLLVEEARPISDAIPPLPAVSRAPEPARELTPLGRFRMTFYYVVNEEDVPEPPVVVAAVDAATSGEAGAEAAGAEVVADVGDGGVTLASTSLPVSTGPELVPVYDKRCKELAQVTPRFLAQMRMQGTGKLRDGRTLNIWGDCECPRTPCYREVEGVRWGYAGNGRALSPFRTVAVDPRKIKLGSLLYVAELDGRTMPGRAPWGGFVHDGCVVADDTGGGVKGHQLDLFVGRRAYYKGLGRRGSSHAWARKVAVYDGSTRCQRTGGKVSASQRGAI
jgi:3D (Asp-Asp-Asp) domain-containing protein